MLLAFIFVLNFLLSDGLKEVGSESLGFSQVFSFFIEAQVDFAE